MQRSCANVNPPPPYKRKCWTNFGGLPVLCYSFVSFISGCIRNHGEPHHWGPVQIRIRNTGCGTTEDIRYRIHCDKYRYPYGIAIEFFIHLNYFWRGCKYKGIFIRRMRSSLERMRSSLLVRTSDCHCNSCNGPGFVPSIRRHSGIWGAADEAVLNIILKKISQKYIKKYKKAHHWHPVHGYTFEVNANRRVTCQGGNK